jgi:hypothetical protein
MRFFFFYDASARFLAMAMQETERVWSGGGGEMERELAFYRPRGGWIEGEISPLPH